LSAGRTVDFSSKNGNGLVKVVQRGRRFKYEKDLHYRVVSHGRLHFTSVGGGGFAGSRAIIFFDAAVLGASFFSAGQSLRGAEPEFFRRGEVSGPGPFFSGASVLQSQFDGEWSTLFHFGGTT